MPKRVKAYLKYYEKLKPYYEKPVFLSARDIQRIWGLSMVMTRRYISMLVSVNFLICVKHGRLKFYTTPENYALYQKAKRERIREYILRS